MSERLTVQSTTGPRDVEGVLVVNSAGEPVPMVPAYMPLQWALRSDRAFIASTGLQSIQNTQALYVKIANPIGSGVVMYLEQRRWSVQDPTAPLVYQAFVNPTLVLTQTAPAANLSVGQPASVEQITYQVGSGLVMGGTPASSNFLEPNLDIPARLFPGTSLGYSIAGFGGSLQNAAAAGVSFVFYTEPLT